MSREETDAAWMRRALDEAHKGRPRPNPHVGAVLVKNGECVGVGHHAFAGGAHAEVAAIEDAGEAARDATMFVTLEPCNHHGRTPPCTEAILRAGIARVVVGARDAFPHEPGATDRMRAAGVDVEHGVLEAECTALVADFFKLISTGMPYVIAKTAVTLDGAMATRTGDSMWITGEAARAEVHRMRDRADAIVVGIGTVLADDPALTVRHVEGEDPIRVVLDSSLRLPPSATLVTTARETPTWVLHAPDADATRAAELDEAGVSRIEVPSAERAEGAEGLDLDAALRALGERDIVRLLVEGGPTLHGALFDAGLVDHVAAFVAPRVLGDARAPRFAGGRGVDQMRAAWRISPERIQRFGDDMLIEGPVIRGADGA